MGQELLEGETVGLRTYDSLSSSHNLGGQTLHANHPIYGFKAHLPILL